MFQNTFFHFLQSVMVFVQSLFCVFKVQIVSCIRTPRKIEHGLQIVKLYAVIRRLWMGAFQFSQFFHKCFPDFCVPTHSFCLLAHFFYFLLLAAATQFILDSLDLLLQEVFALLLVDIFTGTHLDGCLDFCQLHFAVQDFQ